MMNKTITKMGKVANKAMTVTKDKASNAWSFTKDKATVVKKVCGDAKESFLVGFNGTEGDGSICDYLYESNSKVLNITDEGEYFILHCRAITEDRHFDIYSYDDAWYVVEA